jgi:hypothetical protein
MIGGAKWQNFLNTLVYHLSFVICHRAEAKRVAGDDK